MEYLQIEFMTSKFNALILRRRQGVCPSNQSISKWDSELDDISLSRELFNPTPQEWILELITKSTSITLLMKTLNGFSKYCEVDISTSGVNSRKIHPHLKYSMPLNSVSKCLALFVILRRLKYRPWELLVRTKSMFIFIANLLIIWNGLSCP